MDEKKCETYLAKIYLSGPIEVAKQVLRAECMREGLCVTIEPTTYIYTGGEEAGYIVGLVNYPRFPADPATIRVRAELIAKLLMEETHQWSAMVMDYKETIWITSRPEV